METTTFPLFSAAQLLQPDGSPYTGSLNKAYVMLYFSAHWCPPCKRFTPVLSEWYIARTCLRSRIAFFSHAIRRYTQHKDKLDMELVFIR